MNLDKKTGANANMADLAPESLEPTLNKPLSAKNKKGGSGLWLVVLLIIIIVAAAVLFYLDATGKMSLFGEKTYSQQMTFDSSDWQAVFLTNGQVYFGKLANASAIYAEMTNIYYLQVQQVPIQPAEPAADEAGVQPAQQTQQQMILVKFGTELHKPQDKMFINRDHILFYEDLAEDSAVVKSIEDYIISQQAE